MQHHALELAFGRADGAEQTELARALRNRDGKRVADEHDRARHHDAEHDGDDAEERDVEALVERERRQPVVGVVAGHGAFGRREKPDRDVHRGGGVARPDPGEVERSLALALALLVPAFAVLAPTQALALAARGGCGCHHGGRLRGDGDGRVARDIGAEHPEHVGQGVAVLVEAAHGERAGFGALDALREPVGSLLGQRRGVLAEPVALPVDALPHIERHLVAHRDVEDARRHEGLRQRDLVGRRGHAARGEPQRQQVDERIGGALLGRQAGHADIGRRRVGGVDERVTLDLQRRDLGDELG